MITNVCFLLTLLKKFYWRYSVIFRTNPREWLLLK